MALYLSLRFHGTNSAFKDVSFEPTSLIYGPIMAGAPTA